MLLNNFYRSSVSGNEKVVRKQHTQYKDKTMKMINESYLAGLKRITKK